MTLFPQPELADDAEGFAVVDVVGDAIHRANHALGRKKASFQVVDAKNCVAAGADFGLCRGQARDDIVGHQAFLMLRGS